MDLVIDAPHPDTGAPIVGTTIPGWQALTDMVRTASQVCRHSHAILGHRADG